MTDGTPTDRRVAIVTGAAGALGTAMCERFVRDGIRVIVADVAEAPARALADRLDPSGAAALPIIVDMADYATVEAMVARVLAWSGRIDIMVNNAGVAEDHVPTWEMPLEAWQRTIDIDLTGVFYGCRAVLPAMLDRGWGRIINISSIAGKEGKHNPAAYAAAKAGVIGLTKAVAFEVAPHGILVNAITPGTIASGNWAKVSAELQEEVRKRHPVGRVGQPPEVAALVAWLSSDECSFSTGAVFDISGGRASH
jgi:NAD(P)-dependent dehydrogenase (short-subunit alcohol dehydrogenase family)